MNTRLKPAAILAVAVATIVSAASAEARVAHHRHAVHGTVLRGPPVEQYRGSHNYAPGFDYRGSHNYAPGFGGFTPEPNGPDNYNPNASE